MALLGPGLTTRRSPEGSLSRIFRQFLEEMFSEVHIHHPAYLHSHQGFETPAMYLPEQSYPQTGAAVDGYSPR
jgi:hypothetical protein